MEYIIKDFIGIFDGFIPPSYCKELINFFNNNSNFQSTRKSQEPSVPFSEKQDSFLDPKSLSLELKSNLDNFEKYFKQTLYNKVLPLYIEKYGVLENDLPILTLDNFIIQKTLPGEGYHIWHYESSPEEVHLKRLGVWTLYLNDVEEGGETEFLYIHKRIPPKQGRICIFPSAYTHTHRGNPPLSGGKYIITGWINYK